MSLLIQNEITVDTTTGDARVSQRKAAELLGVSQSALSQRCLSQNIEVKDGLTAEIFDLLITHYALDSRNPTTEAKALMKLCIRAGVKAYLYHEAGYVLAAKKPEVQMPQADQQFQRASVLVQMCINNLNLPQSGQLKLMADLGKQFGVPTQFLPSYGIDAPPESIVTTGSSAPTFSLTTGLKDYPMSARTANQILIARGILEECTRPSTKTGEKTFKAFTADGLRYGKNVTSPSNPREVQPHFYVDTFPVILALLGL